MKLIFMGTPESAVPTLRRCVEDGHEVLGVWTQPDRPAGRGNRLKASPVKEYALSRGLTVRQPSKIKTEETLALFTSQPFDAPVNWALVRGERETGVTTMLMDEGLDTGPVLLQRQTAIEEGETAPHILERLSHAG